MSDSVPRPAGDDDLARQRRKRDARLLDQPVIDFPSLTLADVVADVLAASDQGRKPLDVHGYLAAQGHGQGTVEAVVAYLHRQHWPDGPTSHQLLLL